MKIDNNTFAIPPRVEVATEHSLIESTPLTTLEQAWNKLSDQYTSAEHECTRSVQDKQLYNHVLNGKVEIETALVNYDLIRQKVLTLREKGGSRDDNTTVINFKEYCVRECVNTLRYQLNTLRCAISEHRNEERVLQLFTNFKIKIENRRILVRLTDKNVIDITNKLRNDGNDTFRFVLHTLNVSDKIVISCCYEKMRFRTVHCLKDLGEIRKALEITDRNIVAGKLVITVESEDEYKSRFKENGDDVRTGHENGDRMVSEFENADENTFEDEVLLESKMENIVGSKLESRMENTIGGRMESKMGNVIENKLVSELKSELEEKMSLNNEKKSLNNEKTSLGNEKTPLSNDKTPLGNEKKSLNNDKTPLSNEDQNALNKEKTPPTHEKVPPNEPINTITSNPRIKNERFNHLICNFIYTALIHNAEPSYIISKVFSLLAYYVAVNFYGNSRFITIAHERECTQVIFFIRGRDKLRVEIKDQKELNVFYNEARVQM